MSRKSLGVLVACTLLLVAAAPLAAAGPDVGTTAGKSYGEWSAAWWQWLYSIPESQHPHVGQGEVDCTLGQSGPVWFLTGGQAGTTAVRSCTVPRGKSLFFPVLNAIYLNEPGESLTVDDKRDLLEKFVSDTDPGFLTDLGFAGTRGCGLTATLDGLPTSYFVPTARVQSPAFALDTGDDPVGVFPPGLFDHEAVSDGYWVMLPPLSPGDHVLRFVGRFCQFDNFDDHPFFGPVDVTYNLRVVGGVVGGAKSGPPPHAGGPGPKNVEIVQDLYQAFAEGDLDTILAIIHPDVVWTESDGIPYGGTFVGRDAVFEGVFAKIAAEWDGFTAEVDEFITAGQQVITLGRDSGTYKATGKSMTAPTASIWTLNNKGQVVRFVQYIDTLAVMSAVNP